MRFAHRKEYVVEVARDHGLEVFHRENIDGFRQEMYTDVRGDMFVLRKTTTTTAAAAADGEL